MRTLLILLLFSLSATAQRNNLILEQTFDTTRGKWFEESVFFPYGNTVSTYTKKNGKSLKVTLKKGDGIRAELGTDPRLAPKEGWFGFSVFLPVGFVKDPSSESIVQFQGYPDFSLGETWRSPPLMLGILNDRWVMDIRTDSKKVTVQPNYTFERIDLGPAAKSTWTDFVFHIKWAHDNTGVVELWKNDKLIYSRINKPNSFNDALFPYFKIGIYKWEWEGESQSVTKERTIYIDEVRIGNKNASYNDVYPGKKVVKTVKHYNDGSTKTK